MENNKSVMNLLPNDPLRLNDIDAEFATLRISEMGLLGDGIAIFEEDEIAVFGGLTGELVKARMRGFISESFQS